MAEPSKERERPKRIQRKRTRGWRMPPNTVYVGRPSLWGNPYAVGRPYKTIGATTYYVTERHHAIALFREYLGDFLKVLSRQDRFNGDPLLELRGKNLACWCPLVDKDGKPVPCHADVLLEIANA